MFGRLTILVLGLLLLCAHTVSAQETDDVPDRSAVECFQSGLAAADEGRYADAAEAFQCSVDQDPLFANMFNLARVRNSLGESLEAERLLELLLGDPSLSATDRQLAEEQIEEVRRSIARLEITVSGADEAVVRVDGTQVGVVQAGETDTQRVDRGSHVVVGRTQTGQIVERQVNPLAGQTLNVELLFEPTALVVGDEPRNDDLVDDGGSPWPWIIVGGVLVAAAAAVLIVVLVSDDSAECDPVFGCAPI